MLVGRVIRQSIWLFVQYTALMYFTLTLCTVVNNMTPILAVLIGVFVRKEFITTRAVTTLILTFIAVMIVIVGSGKDMEAKEGV